MDDRETEELFAEYRKTGDREIRNKVVNGHRWLAVACAKRFRGSSEPLEDLVQVAQVGLLKAADRFDPSRGVKFSTYAAVTARGELQRYFRDGTWSVKVPRPVKDLYIEVKAAMEDLSHKLGRQPRADELAQHLEVTTDDVLAALEAGAAYSAASDEMAVADTAANGDDGLDKAEDRTLIREAMRNLPERSRKAVFLRYFEERTQAEIADEIGCSQVHVSRVLHDSVNRMADQITTDEEVGLAEAS